MIRLEILGRLKYGTNEEYTLFDERVPKGNVPTKIEDILTSEKPYEDMLYTLFDNNVDDFQDDGNVTIMATDTKLRPSEVLKVMSPVDYRIYYGDWVTQLIHEDIKETLDYEGEYELYDDDVAVIIRVREE